MTQPVDRHVHQVTPHFRGGFDLLACATQMWIKNGQACKKEKTLQLQQQGMGGKEDVG